MRVSPEGPISAKIILLGEAPGEEEERTGRPFVGSSGQELDRLLKEAEIDRDACYITNVFLDRPPNNKLEAWCMSKTELPDKGKGYPLPALSRGKYLDPSHIADSYTRVRSEIAALNPNIIVALGATALWATVGESGISSLRGTVIPTEFGKVLPTFHPAYILRQWSERVILLADLIKAKRHSASPEFSRPSRKLLINPTIEEVEDFTNEHLLTTSSSPIAADIETKRGQITSISFAPNAGLGLVIPLVDERQPSRNYWNLADEFRAWRVIRGVCGHPRPKLFQNGLYDIQYLVRAGCTMRNCTEDTMIKHHAMFPELQKGLGFLGSIYTDEPAWKLMRKRAGDTEKRDE